MNVCVCIKRHTLLHATMGPWERHHRALHYATDNRFQPTCGVPLRRATGLHPGAVELLRRPPCSWSWYV